MNSFTPNSNARFNRIVISALSVALIYFAPSGIEQAQAAPTVKIQKKSGGSKKASKQGGGSRGSMSHGNSGGNHAGNNHSGGRQSSQGHSFNSNGNQSHAGHGHSNSPSYRSNYQSTQPYYRSYNSNFGSRNSNYRSYNSNYRSYPSQSYLSISPYGLSFGVGGVGVSRYYRPTYSNYSTPYSYGYSDYYPGYDSYSGYEGYQPYSTGYPAYPDSGLSPVESTAAAQLMASQTVVSQIPTSAAASSFQQGAEQAFRSGDYSAATEQTAQALKLDPENGQLMLFGSQAHFAVGDFATAAELVNSATKILPSDQWGFVVENFRTFYGRNDYVSQTDRLSELITREAGDAQALALRGYHYGALNYRDAAISDLQAALKSDPGNELANRLLPVLGSDVVPAAEEVLAPVPSESVPLNAPESVPLNAPE